MSKKILFITLTAIVLWCFAYSCAKQNDYDGYVETTTERFSTVEEQVAYLEGLLETLGAEKAVLADYADSLEDAGDARAHIVDSLLEDLGKKMLVVDDSLAKYATKNWADATFATLKIVDSLCKVTAALEVKVKADSSAIAENIEESIKKSEEELTKMFESYYTSTVVDEKIGTLTTRLKNLSDSVGTAKDSVKILETEVADLETSLKTIDERLDSAVNALKGVDTTLLMPKIDSIDIRYSDRFDSLGNVVAANKAALDALEGRIAKLEARVQSVEVVPDYIDGSVKMTKYSTLVKFEVRPASAAKALVAKGVSAFSLQAMKVKAATKASIYTTITVQSASIDAEDSLLVLKVKGSDMPADFSAGTQAYSARLSINDGNTGKSTPYFPLTYVDFTPSYPEAPTLVCPEINGTVWAPVNCGYDATTYTYGKLYQWGRVSPCEYNSEWTDAGGSHTAETPLQTATAAKFNSTTHINDSLSVAGFNNWFYTIDSGIWDWYADDVSYQLASWPMQSGDKGYLENKIANPCPSGWRVPTADELTSLLGSHTGGALQDGTGVYSNMKGKWFDGSAGAQGSGLFLPAAGYRYSDSGSADMRGSGGAYWSSSVSFDFCARYLVFGDNIALMTDYVRAEGYSVRCVYEPEK